MRTQPLQRTQWPARTARACVLLLLAAPGCNYNTDPLIGTTTLWVSVRTTGDDVDLDGYEVTVDGIRQQAVRLYGTAVIRGLRTGDHLVALTGVAENCTVSGLHPRPVTVKQDERTQVTLVVGCRGTGVEVRNTTTGLDLDPDGYLVQVDGGPYSELATNGTTTIIHLRAGSHTVALSAVTANCIVGDPNPRTVMVATGETVPVPFMISCVATTGSIEVTAVTSGGDIDPDGYTVQVDDGPALTLAPNGTTTIAGVQSGDHSVRLGGWASHCTVAGQNPRTVLVTGGGVTRDTARTRFEVTCVTTTGTVVVTSVSSGIDPDPNGYTVQLDGNLSQALPTNGMVTLSRVIAGDHSVRVDSVASNCSVIGPNPRTMRVTVGDTARTTFEVRCVTVKKLAFVAAVYQIAVAYADGSNVVTLAQGSGPAWSPDGTRIAFTAIECYDNYYSYDCYATGLSVINADGSGVVRLTDRPNDFAPAWSPDGSKIAFASSRTEPAQVHLMNADGSGIVRVTSTVGGAIDPDWSPNGTLIAFTCRVASDNVDICTVKPDGTGLVRLTSDPADDRNPAWKPDGSKIAFVTNRYGVGELVVMNADGSGLTRILLGTEVSDPAWSPDGTKIAFAEIACDDYYGCYSSGLFVINADGTGLTRLTTGNDTAPAWRP